MDYTIDYYSVLIVTQAASKEELKASHRHLAKLHHPDKNPGDASATERFRLLQEAYEVLSNDITRHVYDEYRAANEPNTARASTSRQPDGESEEPLSAKTRTFSRTRKVWREKRIYVNGRIHVKFQGVPELVESYMAGREQDYKISPTETLVIIGSSGIHKNGNPKEYDKAYSSAELFAVPLPQPLRCQVTTGGNDEMYELTIHDLKIKGPTITNISRHEQDSFGELVGDCYGFIVHRYEEEVTENLTEYYGATGRVETKESAGTYFSRQQFYSKDGTKYWGEWTYSATATAKAKTTAQSFKQKSPSPAPAYADNKGRYFAWICYLIVASLIWPKSVVALLVVAAVLYLLYCVISLAASGFKVIRWLSALLVIAFFAIGVGSLFHPQPAFSITKTTPYQPLDTRKRALENNTKDTLISHLVQWHDYDSNRYRLELKVLQSAVNSSQAQHQSMQSSSLTSDGPGAIYAQLYRMDTGKLQLVYQAFDSMIQARQLSEMQAAEMVVSCIQSIPYYLIVDQSCTADYNDVFIANYLRNCQNDCCLGYVKFGVQSPAEFVGDLKGDCDTRALVLFCIFSKMGYDVALITSQFYKHAMIAVHFKNSPVIPGLCMPINDHNYYLWETTSAGHRPGAIPLAINNLQYWTPSLIHQQ